MATNVTFKETDWQGVIAAATNIEFTSRAVYQDISTGTGLPIQNIVLQLKGTSPASWSSGKYNLGFEFKIYNSGTGGSLGATLLTTFYVPVVFFQASETSTTKEGTLLFPVNMIDANYTYEVQVIGGQSGYVFTNIEGYLSAYYRPQI